MPSYLRFLENRQRYSFSLACTLTVPVFTLIVPSQAPTAAAQGSRPETQSESHLGCHKCQAGPESALPCEHSDVRHRCRTTSDHREDGPAVLSELEQGSSSCLAYLRLGSFPSTATRKKVEYPWAPGGIEDRFLERGRKCVGG